MFHVLLMTFIVTQIPILRVSYRALVARYEFETLDRGSA